MKVHHEAYVRRIEGLMFETPNRRDAIADARGWLLSRFPGEGFPDEECRENIRLYGDFQVVERTQVLYHGGWRAFCAKFGYVKPTTYLTIAGVM